MSYKVIRGGVVRNGSSTSQPAGPSLAQIREVQIVVGVPIDYRSRLKNFGSINIIRQIKIHTVGLVLIF